MNDSSKVRKYLEQCYVDEKYVFLVHFLSCYIIQSLDWVDFPDMIEDLKKSESGDYHKGLLSELKILELNNDWNLVRRYMDEYADRHLSVDKLKLLFKWLIDGLTERVAKGNL
jgi:hypothetical protein